jgi:hypothetical protein
MSSREQVSKIRGYLRIIYQHVLEIPAYFRLAELPYSSEGWVRFTVVSVMNGVWYALIGGELLPLETRENGRVWRHEILANALIAGRYVFILTIKAPGSLAR